MEHLTAEGLQVCQPQPLRLMQGGPASTGSPMPGAPLLARPSDESVLPHKEGGELRRGDASPL